jgi:hypothetical protein
VLFFESFGVAPYVLAACEAIALFHMFHIEYLVVSKAHMAHTEVDGGAVRRGG